MPQATENQLDIYALDLSTGKVPLEKLKVFPREGQGIGLSVFVCQKELDPKSFRDLHTLAESGLNQGLHLSEVQEAILAAIGSNTTASGSTRFCLLALSAKEKLLSLCCVNYPLPVIIDPEGKLEPDLKLAQGQETKAALQKNLSGGEVILIYTPDLAELTGKGGNSFGEMSIKSLALQNCFRSSEEIALTISQAAWMHHGEIWMEPVNLAVIKYLG